MIDDKSCSLTVDVEVEQLLMDSATPDLFGSPPRNLVQNAMAAISIQEPCEERRPAVRSQLPTVLIVLSLAAAGLFLTTLPGYDAWNRSKTVTVVSPPHIEPLLSADHAVVQPDQSQIASNISADVQTSHSSGIAQVSTASYRRRRSRAFSRRAAKSMWTETVVSESEQGIVIPVVTHTSGSDEESDGQPGVAVVPLQSTTSYAEYTGAGPQ